MMRRHWLICSLLAGLMWASSACAIDPLPFSNAEQETRFRELVTELRCVQCQNQNLADSDSLIAKDLRKQIFEQIQAGQSDDEIVEYLVERYGEFVRYRPAFNGSTLLLWLGPLLIVLGGAVAIRSHLRHRNQRATPAQSAAPLSEDIDW